jgi:hypothetical protein
LISIVDDSVLHYEDEWEGEVWSIIPGKTEESVLAKLHEMTDCPVCILAALRQAGCPFLFPSFKYNEEKEKIWGPVNVNRRDEMLSMIGPVY